ncbi:hypothetical protein KFK09_029392 [Dendrobium nobile]|uniref:Uncharacterized protein n=1 Tax=Dendrobium nobile TaxID=94219 RepID=A0A8T3A0B3_DENNO|nr:hypothetical protein KFK09_029392 [Dendrobium nobile]
MASAGSQGHRRQPAMASAARATAGSLTPIMPQPGPPQAACHGLRRLSAKASAGCCQPAPPQAASHGLRRQPARASAGSQPWPPQAAYHGLRRQPAIAFASCQPGPPHINLIFRIQQSRQEFHPLRAIQLL